jgi:hypothetical protein
MCGTLLAFRTKSGGKPPQSKARFARKPGALARAGRCVSQAGHRSARGMSGGKPDPAPPIGQRADVFQFSIFNF